MSEPKRYGTSVSLKWANWAEEKITDLQRQLEEKQARIDKLVEIVTIASEKQLDPPVLVPHSSKVVSDD